MLLYIFVFFRTFLGNSIDILIARAYYGTASLHLIDKAGNRLSTTTVITRDPNFFVLNDISFNDIQEQYGCIADNFDPIYNPSYSLLAYIQSSQFLALLLSGWLVFIIICVTKSISIWKGGIGNRPNKNLTKYFLVYGFFELGMATLLFCHFYLYHFFYFAGAAPCLNITTFSGLEPYFDSSLYLMLANEAGYFEKIFASLCINLL